MHCDIMKLANQLGWQARVIGNVSINFSVSCGSNLESTFNIICISVSIYRESIEFDPVSDFYAESEFEFESGVVPLDVDFLESK